MTTSSEPATTSRTFTFLFTDLEGSTKLWQQHPEAMKVALARHDALLRSAVEGANGRVVKTTGDGIHAVFSSGLEAVTASLAAQHSLAEETWEETGLVLGAGEGGSLRPALGQLRYVARAITPAGNPIRYHARFFLAPGESVSGELRSNGELLDLAWIPIPRARELNIIDVTQVVLREVAAHLAGEAEPGVPLIHYRRGSQRVRRDGSG